MTQRVMLSLRDDQLYAQLGQTAVNITAQLADLRVPHMETELQVGEVFPLAATYVGRNTYFVCPSSDEHLLVVGSAKPQQATVILAPALNAVERITAGRIGERASTSGPRPTARPARPAAPRKPQLALPQTALEPANRQPVDDEPAETSPEPAIRSVTLVLNRDRAMLCAGTTTKALMDVLPRVRANGGTFRLELVPGVAVHIEETANLDFPIRVSAESTILFHDFGRRTVRSVEMKLSSSGKVTSWRSSP